MHQQVNLRGRYVQLGGDESTQQAYEAECERFRSSMRVPLAVAPRQSVRVRDGVLGPGAEVKLENIEGVEGAHGHVPPHTVLRQLISKGIVLEAHDLPEPPARAT